MAPLALSHAEWQAFESAVGTFHPPPPFLGLKENECDTLGPFAL